MAAILPLAPGLTTGELRARLAKLVIAADPDAAAKRHRVRARQRRVELQPSEDSCATLLGINLPADTALAASNRLTALARALKQAGDPRSLDQLRADTFLNLLLGNPTGANGPTGGRVCTAAAAPPLAGRGGVELTGDLETLTRLANQPGDLAGYGPVIAEIARQVAAQQRRSPWTFTIRDEATGQSVHRPGPPPPTAAMARHVRAGIAPAGRRGAGGPRIYADIDHTIAFELGGLTVPGNLGAVVPLPPSGQA